MAQVAWVTRPLKVSISGGGSEEVGPGGFSWDRELEVTGEAGATGGQEWQLRHSDMTGSDAEAASQSRCRGVTSTRFSER